jgi:hypothetical protein
MPRSVKDLLLGFFPYGTGVEQDDVGLLGLVGLLVALADGQYIGHLVRVVLVHLATKGADEDFAGHSGMRGRKPWRGGKERGGGGDGQNRTADLWVMNPPL